MILVLNAGSSSLKIELFDHDLTSQLTGSVSEIGGHGELKLNGVRQPVATADHKAALALLLAEMEAAGHPLAVLTAVGHRVVHGGATLTAPAHLTGDTIATIKATIPLAPLHNPANLAGIEAIATLLPTLPQCASFDTAFHASCPPMATTLALPEDERAKGLRRYGFHGLSYASLVARINPLPARLLALHLGNGASLCAIQNGRSVATSMGYSPLDGLVMGTRAGAIGGGAVLRLAREHGVDGADQILNRASGLKALAGTNDMRALLARDDDEARFAVDYFCYWAIRHAGSVITAMGGLDALAFTGGIGENAAPIRAKITQGLAFLGPVPVHVLPADEERQIARDTATLLGF